MKKLIFNNYFDRLNAVYGKGDKIQIPPEIAIVIQENGWSNLLEYPNLICQTDDLTLICIDQDTKHIKTINQL